MRSDIDDLCNAFISAIDDAGYARKNIENYRQVSNRFKRFCSENGYDTYTINVGQEFANNVFNEETGEFVKYRHVMYGRFVRLISSFHLYGAFDFSMVTKEKDLPTSTQLIKLYQGYTKYLNTRYPNTGTVGFFQNGMLCLLRYMEKSGISSLTGSGRSRCRKLHMFLVPEPPTQCPLHIAQHLSALWVRRYLFCSGKDSSIPHKADCSNVYG